MVSTLPPIQKTNRGDLRTAIFSLVRRVPQGHDLSILEIRTNRQGRKDLIKPHIVSKSPHEIASALESRPTSEFLASPILARGGQPDAGHWGIVIKTVVTHCPRVPLAAIQARVLMTLEKYVEKLGFDHEPYHVRDGNSIYSLFYRNDLLRASWRDGESEVDGVSSLLEAVMKLEFPPPNDLDQWIRYKIEGGDVPITPPVVDALRTWSFPLSLNPADYDIKTLTLLSEFQRGVAA